MSDEHTRTSKVEVPVDPPTAFKVFTEEMDRWWVPGPINFFDSARAVAVRCESGVGGRLLEVYEESTGEGLELGRITAWEPGKHLAWKSSVDDVETDIRFEPTGEGTRVVVEARVPAGGVDQGGSSWVSVAPSWFGAWFARRDTADPGRPCLSRLAVAVQYSKPATAARWIGEVLGLESNLPLPIDDAAEHQWVEFRVGDGLLVVLKKDEELAPTNSPSHIPWVFVDDLDAHFAAAQRAGAEVVQGIHQHGYRAYSLRDLEGHHWTVAQTLPSMSHPG
jgi:uncharacterized glyoxalase superfamily protein PhnB